MDTCIFCEILAGNAPASIVYQDEICTVLLDIQPINAGHLLVIPNLHAESLATLDPATGGKLFQVAQQMAARLRKSTVKCEGINLFLADGKAAMQEVFHVHLHVIPRFSGDGFGLRFGDHYWEPSQREQLDALADELRNLAE